MLRGLGSKLTQLSYFVLSCIVLASLASAGEALKAEDVVSKHLDSIGTAKARADVKSRADEGTVEFRVLSGGPGGVTSGSLVILSEGHKTLFMMKLPTVEYHGERFIFDGSKTEIRGATGQQTRSALGNFLWVQDAVLKEGLLGGVLTTSWPLLDLNERKAKLSVDGSKTIDGQQLIEMHYQPKKKSDLDIHFYFDPQTYHHVRSVYTLTVTQGLGQQGSSPMGVPPGGAPPTGPDSAETNTARQNEIRYRLEERFSDFATVDGLTLPMHYTIQFTNEQQNGHSVLSQWDNKLSAIKHNVSPDPRNFEVK
ncbi:MAG TPA: hypothetical protein VMI10_20140 [Terriglobales bacterium]|nr:hypothetical protein [Terriglobales bacterium]